MEAKRERVMWTLTFFLRFCLGESLKSDIFEDYYIFMGWGRLSCDVCLTVYLSIVNEIVTEMIEKLPLKFSE